MRHNTEEKTDRLNTGKFEKELKTVKAFLNSALSLSFLVKDNPNNVEKFVNYRTR